MRKTAILTFDYEVFLGSKTGSLENSVLRPASQIIEILKNNNARAIFFVDATWLLFLNENCPSEFAEVARQLKEIVSSGSSVELHLHPHWRHAFVENGEVKFRSYDNYRLQSLDDNEINSLFHRTVDLLEGITNQKITCFRAGGFAIRPFNRLSNVFSDCGILFDFSVAPGMTLKSGNDYDYDFSDSPRMTFYRFSNDVCEKESDGMFTEIPLTTYRNNPFYRLLNRFMLKLSHDRVSGDGKGIQEQSNYFLKSLTRRLNFSRAFLTFDFMHFVFFRFLLLCAVPGKSPLVIISHPKVFSRQVARSISYVARNYETINSAGLKQLVMNENL